MSLEKQSTATPRNGTAVLDTWSAAMQKNVFILTKNLLWVVATARL